MAAFRDSFLMTSDGCRTYVLLTLTALSFFAISNDALAQQQRRVRPMIGDIIEYDDFHKGMTYGLITEVDRMTMKVERLEDDGSVRQTTITGSTQWQMIDRARKEKKSSTRTWNSKDGKSRIEASFDSVEDGKVRLKKSNGKIILVPVDKLSEADQKYIQEQTDESSGDLFDVEEENDYPDDVVALIDRRNELMVHQSRHQRLARQGPMRIGDIIFQESRHAGPAYGIIYSTGVNNRMETVGKNGSLRESHLSSFDRWWYFDRELIPLVSRTWSSSSGKFKISAKLIDIEPEDKLVLEKSDGEVLRVPLSKLGKADKTYVKRNRDRLSAINADDSSLADLRADYGEELQILLDRRKELVKRAIAGTVAANDAARMKNISLNTRKLTLTNEQLRPVQFNGKPFSILFTTDLPQHARVERVAFSSESGLIAFVAASPFFGTPVLMIADPETSEVVTSHDAQARIGDDAVVLAISPSGKTVLIYSEQDRRGDQLELWRHVDGTLERTSVVPYKSSQEPAAHLFSDETGAILNHEGELVFFDLAERIKPTHIVPKNSFFGENRIQISEDMKSVFYLGKGGSSLHIIDIASKQCVGGVMLGDPQDELAASARVNADGKTATHTKDRVLSRIDLTTGKTVSQHELPPTVSMVDFGSNFHRIAFPLLDQHLIKTFHDAIFDVRLGVEIGKIKAEHRFGAQYFSASDRIVAKVDSGTRDSRGGFGDIVGAGQQGPVRNNEPIVSSRVQVSYERLDVDAIRAFADSLNENDIVTFGQGDSVRFDIDLGDNRLDRELEQKISNKMSENGIGVADNAEFVFVVRFNEGRSETRNFRIVGGPTIRNRSVTMIPKTCSAKLMLGDQVVWSQTRSVSIGHPFSEDGLNRRIADNKKLSPRVALDFNYPTEQRVLDSLKKKTFEWK